MDVISTSPSGRYEVRSSPWEARMSHWIHPPCLFDRQASDVVYAVEDTSWSVDRATWEADSVVRLELRKYPGGEGMDAVVTIDCAARTASIGGCDIPLEALDSALEKLVPE